VFDLGNHVVLRKLSFIGDGVAHASFAGIVIAYIRGMNFELGAAIVAVLTGSASGTSTGAPRVAGYPLASCLRRFRLGVFLMSRVKTSTVDLQDFLFGNILGVGPSDLWIVWGSPRLVVAAIALELPGAPLHRVRPDRGPRVRAAGRLHRIHAARTAGTHDRDFSLESIASSSSPRCW